ncbi:hypothetical protein HYX16_03770 [Candidatus Woesearchaeota archaeon]|nr:hypothetical protein [Candidatus Woesearchaeota archaeon]
MNFKKITSLLALPVLAYSLTFNSIAQAQEKKEKKSFLLENISSPEDEIDRVIEETRVNESYKDVFAEEEYAEGIITVKKDVYDGMTFYFHNFVDKRDKIIYYDGNGAHSISREEFKVLEKEFIEYCIKGVEKCYNQYKELRPKIIASQEEHLKEKGLLDKDKSLKEILDKKVPDLEGILYKETLKIPEIEKNKFAPREVHFGHSSGLFGLAYLDTRAIQITPKGYQVDYINRSFDTFMHENTHAISDLQDRVGAYSYNFEFGATMVEIPNIMWFLIHSYLADARELSKVLFHFDSDRVLKECLDKSKPKMGVKIDKEKMRVYLKEVDKIRKKISGVYLNEFLPKFIANRTYYESINRDLKDVNAAFKIFMYLKYEPTSLGGDVATIKWLKENEQVVDEILKKSKKDFKEFEKIARKEYSFTPDQVDVLVIGGLRKRYGIQKEVGEKLTFQPNYSVISLEDRLMFLEERLNRINLMLNSKDKYDIDYIDGHNLRAHLEKTKKINEYFISRNKLAILYKEFRDLMNEPKDNSEYYIPVESFSDLEIIFPGNDLSRKLKFTTKSVEKGLKEENIIEDLEVKVIYYEQEDNPDYPKKDPNNSRVVVKRERKIRLRTYDFDKDNKEDYIDGYRLREDETPESKPAVKIFKPLHSSELKVLVVDYDRETNKSGFGIPDEIKEVSGISKGSDFYLGSQETIESLFREMTKEKTLEAITDLPPMKAEIVEVGEIKPDEYEINVEGWTTPDNYKLNGGKNYDLWIKFKKEDLKEDEPKEIEYIAKRFHAPGNKDSDSQGRVVEFYRPRKEFLEGILMIEKNDEKHLVKIRKANGPIMEYVDSSVLEGENPFKIEYDSGDFRETIEDQNKTPEKNSIYETKRRQRALKELSLVNHAKDY